ncbi:glycosyltransferase family 87 protein [Corynebacterium bovis]|uniref:glycosyltransferase family 87 protein n=2 Tax=Corynebacterium bovis TaxID=36808 RepID=UPI003139EF8A
MTSTTYHSATPAPSQRTSTVLACVAWPVAIMTFLHRVFLVPQNAHPTDDFTTVFSALTRFRDGVPVYDENYSFVDPHYLYSPGGTLLLSPLAWLPGHDLGRLVFIVANAVAVVVALALLTRMCGRPLRGGTWSVAVALAFMTESVTNTLLFSNINGVLLLLEVLFMLWLLRGRTVLSGVALGLAITVKPIFAPLLVLPLLRGRWATVVSGIAVPVVFTAAAWPLTVRPGDYVHTVMPYLGVVRDYANSSLSGVGVYYGLPPALTLILRALTIVLVGLSVVLLLQWRKSDELLWVTTSSGVILTGVFLASSLGQMYYSMLIFPMVFTVVLRRSVMHNPVAWFGLYLCLSPDVWSSDRWVWWGRIAEYTRGTVGWGLIVIAVAATVVVWTVRERGRPAGPHRPTADSPATPAPAPTAPNPLEGHRP